jgi:hypothetical protein
MAGADSSLSLRLIATVLSRGIANRFKIPNDLARIITR